MKNCRKILVMSLVLLMMTTSVYAGGTDNIKGKGMENVQAKIVKEEIVNLNGENVVLTTYDNNGVTTITATSQDDEQLSPDTYAAVSNYLDNGIQLRGAAHSTTQTGYSSTNGNCSVKMNCSMNATTMTPFKLYITGGYTEGCYMGSGTAASMRLSQKYDWSGVGVTISYPPGFSASGSTATWVGVPSANCNYEKAYRDTDISGTCLVSTFSLTCTDYADIKVGTTTHKSNTSWKQNILFDFAF